MKNHISLIVSAAASLLAAGCSKQGNEALYDYLGNPVAPPTRLAAAYTKTGLTSAVQDAAHAANVTLTKVEIDDSEFPFLVGVVCENQSDLEKLEAQLRKTPGYIYGGGTSSRTICVTSITPDSAFPMHERSQIHHRLMLREVVFFNNMSWSP